MVTRMRSPNYPSISLQEAITRVQKIHMKAQKHPTEPLVIAQLMGYSSLNGGSHTAISNLKKYGLLEDVGKQLKVSQEAISILFDPKTSPEYIAAIKKAALTPALFLDMHNQYGTTPPSDEVLKAFLIKKGFSHTAVDAPIRSYRETMDLMVALPDDCNEKYDVSDDYFGTQHSQPNNLTQAASDSSVGIHAQKLVTFGEGAQNEMRQDVFSLDEGPVVLQWPVKMSSESYEDFESWIQLQLRKIKRSIVT